MAWTLTDFVEESNRIEGIDREPTEEEVEAHETLLRLPSPLGVDDVCAFVEVIAPGKPLRERVGMNVRVGNHVPPCGGPFIRDELAHILDRVESGTSPWLTHIHYETLHPFMDGNGRSGRAIWLWQYSGHAPLGFLHAFYYETLSHVNSIIPHTYAT